MGPVRDYAGVLRAAGLPGRLRSITASQDSSAPKQPFGVFNSKSDENCAAAPMMQYELARGLLGGLLTMVLGDHREREIDPRGDARRRPHIAVMREDLVRLELHLGRTQS